jgi:hypothetical protein
MPGIAFVSGSSAGPGGGVTAVTVNAPASIVAGNLLVAFVAHAGASGWSGPAGWTKNAESADHYLSCWNKTATGSEPSSYTWTVTGTSNFAAGVILQYSGATGFDGTVTAPNRVTSTTYTASSVSPTTATDMWIVAAADTGGWSDVASIPSGFTARNSANSGFASIYSFEKILASSSATGTAAGTWTGGGSAGSSTASALLVPAPTAVNGTAALSLGPLTAAAAGGVPTAAGLALGPLAIAASGGPGWPCGRMAWLELDGNMLLLEDPAAGYFCSGLDLGFPTARDVLTNRPDQNGATDRTQYFGIRTINAQIEALSGAGARVDEVYASFGPYLDPAARPELHYVLDRPGNPERVITVRAAGFTGPIAGPYQRSIQVQFIAADPIAYDPATRTATATPAVNGTLNPSGDLPARPLFRITGPITGPALLLTSADGPPWQLTFLGSFMVAAGHHVDVDTAARTVLYDSNPALPRLASLDWTVSSWQWVTSSTVMDLNGTATSGATQATATWQDGYLT